VDDGRGRATYGGEDSEDFLDDEVNVLRQLRGIIRDGLNDSFQRYGEIRVG
jgi:hypothetical protein